MIRIQIQRQTKVPEINILKTTCKGSFLGKRYVRFFFLAEDSLVTDSEIRKVLFFMKFNQNNVNEGQRKLSAYWGSVEVEDNCKLESLQVVAMKRLSRIR